ncbi:uncharacterized protein LOC129304906 isoform X1 [Prosopis cineraria]|uniref:uncharacterized protein LOC129304906 isoform X1 n=1 Tax=Prosopis cineraria TaxID=364024 RepID=UPI002410392B|nr:uncharacterized protein LOC129304906 isoform X1 [Prosopis cineraria]
MSWEKECPPSTSVQQVHGIALAAKGKRKMHESELPLPSTPPKSTPHFQLSSPETSSRYSPRLLQRMQSDTCFRCGQQGHWMRDCPVNSQNLKYKGLTSENTDIPKIYCRCGYGVCEVRTAKNDRNYGKKYYVCPIKRGKKCKDFVGWCDGKVDESHLHPPPYKYPMCSCGAGVCRKVKQTGGENEGRYFFACPIGGDHGACSYHLWEDALLGKPNIAPIQPGSQSTLHDFWDKESNRLDEDNVNDLGMDGDSPSKRIRLLCDSELVEGEDDVLSIEGRDPTELSSCPNHLGFPKLEAAEDPEDIDVLNTVSWNAVEEIGQSIINLSTASGIRARQREFQMQISTDVDASFDPYPMDWLGRLAFFHPTLNLKLSQPKPLFCCVFPSFNAIITPTEKINHDGFPSESNQLVISNPGEHAILSTDCLFEGFRNAVSTNVSLTSERKPMSKAQRQKQIVLNALKDLLFELESMNPLDYVSMRKAAEDTFDLLKTLPVDYKKFSEHVWEFINSTSSSVEVQNSAQNDLSLEEHIQHYEEEKLRLSGIHDNFVKTNALLKASQWHSQSLREKASRLKEMLQGVESQQISCEMKIKKMETQLGEINASMREAEESLKITAKRLGLAKKLSQEIEAKQLAAKTALEKAKLELER